MDFNSLAPSLPLLLQICKILSKPTLTMYVNVQITSTETIKPFSPTPPENRIYKRSLLDQLVPVMDVDCVLFYPKALELLSTGEIHDRLKLSLSKALTHFYPLAGRPNNALTINCNDLGVSYTEAEAPCDMSQVIMNLEAPNHPLLELIPMEKLTDLVDKDRPFLCVQVNTFTCGGVAIGVKVSHSVADASSLASFLNHWAGISLNPANSDHRGEGIVIDFTSLFPPIEFPVPLSIDLISPNRVVKRFVFDGSKLSSLREIFQGGRFSQRCATRFVAVATLIWAAIINISRERKDGDLLDKDRISGKSNATLTAVNLRKRMDPPLPGRSLGNVCHVAVAEWPMNKAVDLTELAEIFSDSMRFLNDPNVVRDLYSDDKWSNPLKGRSADFAKDPDLFIGFSSWCRFPFYETDFGWGKPDLVGVSMPLFVRFNSVIFIDTKDGEGMEAWIGLSKEDMSRFVQDFGILRYATFGPT